MARRRTTLTTPLPERTVASPTELRDAVTRLERADVIGLDTEFIGEESYRPELCLIQIATARELLLIDPYVCGDLKPFWDTIHDPSKIVVVHAGREEVRMAYFASGNKPRNVFDLQIAAGLVGYLYPIGYAGLVQEVLHQRMNKSETLTDWRRRPLSLSQIRYAYDDVRHLIPIHAHLHGKLVKWDRTHWAAEEFHEFIEHSTNEEVAVEKWRKVKGLGVLARRELAVARELFSWREDFASRTNRPGRYLMLDDLLLEVCRRIPSNLEELQAFRGLPRSEMGAILDAVQRGASLPSGSWPALMSRDGDPPQVNALANLLSIALGELCRNLKLAPNLAATQTDLKILVRTLGGTDAAADGCGLRHGWRAAAILPFLERILAGSLVLRVGNPNSRHPVRFEPYASANSDDRMPKTLEDDDEEPDDPDQPANDDRDDDSEL